MKEVIGISIIIGCFLIAGFMEEQDERMKAEFKQNKEMQHVER